MTSLVAFRHATTRLALQHARQSVVIDPEFWIGYIQLGQAYGQTGNFEHALEALMRAARLSGGNSKALSMRAFLLATSGRAEMRELLKMSKRLLAIATCHRTRSRSCTRAWDIAMPCSRRWTRRRPRATSI